MLISKMGMRKSKLLACPIPSSEVNTQTEAPKRKRVHPGNEPVMLQSDKIPKESIGHRRISKILLLRNRK